MCDEVNETVTCGNCKEYFAEEYCEDHNLALCTWCNRDLHRSLGYRNHARTTLYQHVMNKKTYPSKIVFLEKQMDSLPLDKIDKVIYASADKHCFGQNMIAVSDESIAEKWAPRLNDDHWQKTTDSPNIVSDV